MKKQYLLEGKKAIVTGSTGLVGAALTKFLLSEGIQVLCLGRQNLSPEEVNKLFGSDAIYLKLPMNTIGLLPEKVYSNGWDFGDDTVFYHFAWSGVQSLVDGSFDIQLNNAIYAAEAVKVARSMKCTKFINVGSMEETFIEQNLGENSGEAYQSAQTYYGLAKLSSKNICRLTAYLEKIDYVHTRMSVPLASDLASGGYVSSTLMKIFREEEFQSPLNKALFDIILLEDVVRAFYLIGLRGRNKSDYFIGTGNPQTLHQYFYQFSQLCSGNELQFSSQDSDKNKHLFDVQHLKRDLDFVASRGLDHVLSTLRLR